jgi:glycosyltransferase involved in cell wall biosynthesis
MPLHGFGGLERSVRDLTRHLAARDVAVTLIVPPARSVTWHAHEDPFSSPRIRLRHVSYLTFPFANRRGTTILDRSTAYLLYGFRAGRLAGELARAGEADIVHGFGASILGYAKPRLRAREHRGGQIGAFAPAPLVLNPQGLEEFGATADSQTVLKRAAYLPLQRAVRLCARAADRILATDTALEPTVIRHLQPEPEQLHTIPNGIDLAEVRAAGPAEGRLTRQRHGIPPGEIVLLTVARLEQNKGLEVLANALARAGRPDGPMGAVGWRWVIVGGGPHRRSIERAIEEQGIGSHVVFAGRVSDQELHAWYEAASLFVHPTLYEGSSLVTLEAMAHRKAVIATNAGGLPDKVHTGVNGWLVEAGNVDELAAALESAATDTRALPDMGARSRDIVEREFSWSVLIDRQLALYDELLRS